MNAVDQQAAARAAAAQSERVSTQHERSRDAMFARVSHDLRSPLFSISMALDLVEKLGAGAPADAKVERALATIRRSAARLLEIANDLSDLASLEGGHLALALGPVEPGALLRVLCDDFAAHAAGRSIVLACALEEGLPQANWDGARLRRALSCLVSAVLDATPSPGSVSFIVRHRGARLEICAGPTQPRRDRSSAEPVLRADASPALQVAAGIIRAHGGTLELDTPGAFALSLPLAPVVRTPA